jgi:hypothetical protein
LYAAAARFASSVADLSLADFQIRHSLLTYLPSLWHYCANAKVNPLAD